MSSECCWVWGGKTGLAQLTMLGGKTVKKVKLKKIFKKKIQQISKRPCRGYFDSKPNNDPHEKNRCKIF